MLTLLFTWHRFRPGPGYCSVLRCLGRTCLATMPLNGKSNRHLLIEIPTITHHGEGCKEDDDDKAKGKGCKEKREAQEDGKGKERQSLQKEKEKVQESDVQREDGEDEGSSGE